ncbi:GTP cyclohydrolase I FolE [Enterococcus timonensis]|uniref:GTP cyclohydrolase I FolE n=1 Tax=Enterococcus timonensis TaxID=1852364 RepID=UPI0008DA5FB4|nr:GTP cyclohydrolase I FolE [Enterococcus timonensis]
MVEQKNFDSEKAVDQEKTVDQEKIVQAVKMILEAVGEDVNRPGLLETPQRVARMYTEVFSGLQGEFSDYKLFPTKNVDDLVVVEDIDFYSMCEHHLLPFFGTVTVGYIPTNGQVLGLSKFPRLVQHVASRPSVQEDLTAELADLLNQHVPNDGVVVLVKARHLCMTMRGIKTPEAVTTTIHFSKNFPENKKSEFWQAIK